MICKECGNEILPGTLFCTNCGAKAEAPEQEADSDKTVVLWDEEPQQPKQDDDKTVVLWDDEPQSQGSTAPRKCPNCGSENMGDALFCVECGALMSETKPQPVTPPPAAQPSMTTPPPAMEQQGKPKKEKAPKQPKQQGEAAKNGKLPIIIGAAVAVVVVIIGAIFVMSGLSSKSAGDGRLVYLKDDEFYMAKRSSFQPELITDSFFEDDDNADSVRGMWDVDDDEDLFQYTEDGKYLFYPQDSDDYGVFDLYYKKAGSKEEGTKLESGISSYHVCSADKILYVKSDKLYLASLKGEKEKLASDVDDDYNYDYGTSENGQYIFWYDEDENYYVQDMNLKKEKVKIKDVSYVVDISKDMKEIYYMSDDTLYVMKNLKDKVKIASDVDRVYMLGEGDNKKLYYTTLEDDTPYTYADLVKNDVKKDSEYYEYADEILEDLEDYELNVSEYKAYTYSAATGKSEEVAGFAGEKGIIWGNDGDCMAYYFDIDIDACDKLKLSDVIDDFYFGYSDVSMNTAFDYYWKEQADFYLLTADKRIPVAGMQEFYEKPGKIKVRDFALNSVTKEVYMSVWYSAEDASTYDLYVIPYTDKEVECRLITNDLYDGRLWQSEQGIAYLCDVDKDGDEGTLFLNGIELAKDVYPGYIRASEDALYYIKDINSDHDEGTLYMNKNGKETEIAEDVASYYYGVLSDGSVAYLADYSYKKYKGDLFVFTGRKSIAVDEDVAAVILY